MSSREEKVERRMNRMPALARVLLNFSKELLAIISLAYEQRRRKLGGGRG